MCCGSTELLELPPAAIEMLARYRGMAAERGWDWGDERVDMFRWARFGRLGDVFAETGDWPAAVRRVVGAAPPAGIVVVRVGPDGVTVRTGPPRPVVAGVAIPLDVVVDSAVDREVTAVVAGRSFVVPPGGAGVETVDVDAAPVVTVDGAPVSVAAAVAPAAAARLRLRSAACARWSVVDGSGGAWFPPGVLRKWDVHDRPFFHADDVEFDVPAVPLTVTCARGLEYGVVTRTVLPGLVECDPPRLVDPPADGWYGGDLHVHMNYSGDLVCTPADVARMQRGEGLALVNLTAGNCQTSLVYDRDLLEATAGQDLWADGEAVARAGVEFRNDLLGHVVALGPTAPPSRWYTGHERSDHPDDWPPNRDACAELRALDAVVTYPHPAFAPFGDDGATDSFFAEPRMPNARELVVDAALGLVDSVDLISPFDDEAAVHLYHRLLGCGLRLAATAGTDVFLSFSRGPGVASNPPGWGRVYAQLDGAPLSVAAFQDAIRRGRTVVTNGPWLTLSVAGPDRRHGPGDVLDVRPGERLAVTARVAGGGTDSLAVVGPDGVVASATGPAVECEVAVDGPTWLAAVARGPRTPVVLDTTGALAHTTPVFVDVDGARVARRRDAGWCLELVDGLERLLAEHGRFRPEDRDRRLAAYAELLDEGRRYYREVRARAPR